MIRAVLLTTAAAVIYSTPAVAQGNPRDFGRAGPAQEMQKYYAQVQKEVYEEVLLRWRNAASAEDVATLAKLYADKASYYPPSLPMIQTRSAIRDHFAGSLRDIGTVDVGLVDFGMSGDLAFITARIGYHTVAADGVSREINRTDLLVVRRASNGDWLIQTHLAREEPLPAQKAGTN